MYCGDSRCAVWRLCCSLFCSQLRGVFVYGIGGDRKSVAIGSPVCGPSAGQRRRGKAAKELANSTVAKHKRSA
eukprot:8241524-Alexandrium_andersonii.AAC.1